MPIELVVDIVRAPLPDVAAAIIPAGPRDFERLERVRRRTGINAMLRGPHRSRDQEDWYRALVRYVADGVGMHPDTLHAELRFAAGKVKRIFTSEKLGTAVELKSSTEMDFAEYAAFVAEATDIIFRDYLPGVRRKDVLAVVDKMVKPTR